VSSQKVKDLELDEFVMQVLDKDDELAKQVKASEINAEKIIAKAKPNIDKYGLATGIAFAVARLKEAVLEANSEEVKGLLVGQRDRFGSNTPVKIPLLSSKGDHMELINWGNSVKYGDAKIELPFPSAATVKVLTEGEYKGVPSIRLIAVKDYTELSIPDAISRLNKVAKSVGELDGNDELRPVVVKGKISFVAPMTKWKDKEKDGAWQIYMPNGRDTPVKHPLMQISLASENGNMVRASFDRQRNVVPTFCMEDFEALCIDAAATSTDPVEQARFLGEIIKGRDVIIVGFCTKVNPQAETTYIEIGAYALFDADPSTQATITRAEPAQKGKDSKGKKPAEAEKETEDAPAKKSSPAGKKGKTSPVDKLKERIRTYAETLQTDINDISADKIIEVFKLEGVMEKSSVETAIEELQKE
jgi:hypothetical protein